MKKTILILFSVWCVSGFAQAQVVKNDDALLSNVEVKVYPNPATSYIIFDLKDMYEPGMSIQLFQMIGRKVQEISNPGEKTTVNLTEFTRGLYVYHLRNKAGQLIKSGKFNVSK